MKDLQIVNPETGRYVSLTGRKGSQILKLYSQHGGKPIIRFPKSEEIIRNTKEFAEEEAFEQPLAVAPRNQGRREQRVARAARAARNANPEIIAQRAARAAAFREQNRRRRAELNQEQRRQEAEEMDRLNARIRAEIALERQTIRQLLAQGTVDDSQLLIRILNRATEVNGQDYSHLIHNGRVDTDELDNIYEIINAQKPENMSIVDYLQTLR